MKADVWKSITDKVNAIGVARRTTGEIKDKWRTMVSSAKKDFSRVKQQQKQTGGGSAPAPVKETSRRIIELFEDEPSFSGISGGMESGSGSNMQLIVNEPAPDPDNHCVIDDSFLVLDQPSQLIENELLPMDDSPLMSPATPISTINVELITSTPSMCDNKPQAIHTTQSSNSKKKKRKVTAQDIQRMQMEILELERDKIAVELENAKLIQKKLKLELKKAEEAN